jgi:hypothetical protein
MGGSEHSYSEEEAVAFACHVNNCLGTDPDLADVLPLDPHSDDIFTKHHNGMIFSKLINLVEPGTVTLNKNKKLNIYQKNENMNKVIEGAKKIGCVVVNIGPTDLIDGTHMLVLGNENLFVKIRLKHLISSRIYYLVSLN